MNEQLEEKLVADLRKSGYYSEMRAIEACIAANWQCYGSATYFDKDVRATRECDFEAVRVWPILRNDGSSVQAVTRLMGQVKKSEAPWIVFMNRQLGHARFRDGSDNIIDASAVDQELVGDVLRQHSLMKRMGWTGSGIHEAFKKPTDASRWYSAFVSACKAAESALDTVVANPQLDRYFQLIKPVVVLDGDLIAAELSASGEVVLTETDNAPFAFEYRSDAYDRPRYYLDVVTLDAFPRYLDSLGARMTALVEVLRQ